MTCKKAVRLVEKLADGEATPSERARAEAHIESCEDCRQHYQFVRALESASENIDLPEPREAYWQHFPSRVMARLDPESKANRGSWVTWLTPGVLRFGVIAATVTVVVAVRFNVWRDEPSQLEPAAETAARPSPPPELSVDERVDEKLAADPRPRSRADAPPTALEEPLAETKTQVSRSARTAPAPAEPEPSERDDVAGWDASLASDVEEEVRAAPATAPPPDARATRTQRALAEAPGEPGRPAETEEMPFAAEATLASQGTVRKESPARARAAARSEESCTLWRQYLERNGDGGEQSLEARYRVALCSIDAYQTEPSDENLEAARRDVNAFVAVEQKSDRAEDLRQRLRQLGR